MTHLKLGYGGVVLLLPALAALSLGVGCSGSDRKQASSTTAGGATASGGEPSSGGAGSTSSRGGSDTGEAGTAGSNVGPRDCDVDGDEYRSLDCGGDDCDDQSDEVSPEIDTDLNLSSTPPVEEGSRRVFQVATGAADELFVLYRLGEGELRLATWSEGEWTSEGVGSTPVEPSAGATMAIDADGKFHVALLSIVPGTDPVRRDLYYATNAGGTWEQVQVTDSSATHPSGLYPRIALDGDGFVHVVFHGEGVQHATNASGSWVVTEIASGGRGALATDPGGTVHAVLASGFATQRGPYGMDGFALAGPVQGTGSGDLVAAFDADGRLHAVAVGLDEDSDRVLKYTIFDGATATLVDTGISNPTPPQVVRGADGEVHVFSGVKLPTGHLVGMVHGFYGAAGFEKRSVHSTPSYEQEDFGFPSLDSGGHLHRVTPSLGQHRYSDDVDNDCDGQLW